MFSIQSDDCAPAPSEGRERAIGRPLAELIKSAVLRRLVGAPADQARAMPELPAADAMGAQFDEDPVVPLSLFRISCDVIDRGVFFLTTLP